MANEAPDPRTFESWDSAFQYPIPVVHKLSQQLRSNAVENREKLRSLVGASYRDLLSTAETIIDMELRMQTVESNLAKMGHNCNSRNLDRIARNVEKGHMGGYGREVDVEKYGFASQLAVLRGCIGVVERLLKSSGDGGGRGGGGYLLIAKVLVVARLLYKALSQRKEKDGGEGKVGILDQLRDKLGSLRSRLLKRVDRRLASPNAVGDGTDVDALVESMCAYSLATSSTPTDVLRHFHHVRMEKIMDFLRKREAQGTGLKENGIKSLQLCLQTCQDTQTIFPRRLADALSKLKAQPLVQDSDVRALYELNLDIHERWIGDEARNYTPWPRHDELSKPEAEKLLSSWAKQAISAFLKGLKTALEGTKDLKEVAELRQEVVETWIMSGSRMAGVKSSNVLDNLRDTMNGQLGSIVRERAMGLRSIVEAIKKALNGWEESAGGFSLWKTDSAAPDLSNGAQKLKARIVNTYQGRDGAVIRVVGKYDEWMDSVLEVKGIVKSMKETRWDDPFSDDVDLDDSDDEVGGDSKQTLLSGDDPRLFEEVTQDALSNALSSLGKSFAMIVEELTDGEGSKEEVAKAIFILRIVREISDRIPRLRLNDRATALSTPFSAEVLKPLHQTLASHIVTPVVEAYSTSLEAANRARSKYHILWEGNPPLPAQPSPSAFRFLQRLVANMASYGSDLWAPESVKVLKGSALEEVVRIWKKAIEAINESKGNTTMKPTEDDTSAEDAKDAEGSEKPDKLHDGPSADELKTRKLTQMLYDILYIQRYLLTSASTTATDEIVRDVEKAVDVDESMKTRLRKNAGDYARKTYLLFALLA